MYFGVFNNLSLIRDLLDPSHLISPSKISVGEGQIQSSPADNISVMISGKKEITE